MDLLSRVNSPLLDAIQQAGLAVGVLDRDLCFVAVSEALAAINGVPAAEHVGRYGPELLPGLADNAWERMRRVIETGEPDRHVLVTGTTLAPSSSAWAEDYTAWRDASTGEIIGVIASVTDVSSHRRAEAAASRRQERIAGIAALASSLIPLTSMPEIADVIARHAAAMSGACAAVVTRVTNGAYSVVGAHGYSGEAAAVVRNSPLRDGSALSDTARTGNWHLLNAGSEWDEAFPAGAAFHRAHGFAASASVPLIQDEGVVGSIGLSYSAPQAFDDEDRSTLTAIASVAAQALQRAEILAALDASSADLRRRQALQAYLVRLSDAVRPLIDPADVLRVAMELLVDHLDASAALYSEITGPSPIDADVRWAHVRGGAPAPFRPHRLDAYGPGAAAELVAGRTLVVDDVSREEGRTAHDLADFARLRTAAFVAVPVTKLGALVGYLAVSQDAPREWTDEDVDVIQATAERTWAAVEQARAESALREEREAALAAETERRRAAEAFLGVMSHELKTPATVAGAAAALLARNPARDDAPGLIDDISAELDRLVLTIDHLLVLSGVAEGGELRLAPEPVLVGHAVNAAIARVKRSHPALTSSVRLPDDLPLVLADGPALHQVLTNILVNACKYAGGSVSITADAAADGVRLVVDDTGPGLGDDPERLFELFYRGEAAAAKASGTGIGLYVVRALMRGMGGSITAANTEAGGRFVLWLPVAGDEM